MLIRFKIYLTERALKEINQFLPLIRERILKRIEELSLNPLPRDSMKISELRDVYCITVDNLRIFYKIIYKEKRIIIFKISPRRSIVRRTMMRPIPFFAFFIPTS